MKEIQTIGQIWNDQYPPSKPRHHLLIEKVLMTPVLLLRLLSLDRLKSLFGDKAGHRFMDCYVLAFAATLTTILFLPKHLCILGGIVAAYRLEDIVIYRLFFLLVKSQAYPWTAERLRRSLIIAVMNFLETIVGFAIVYLTFGNIVPTSGPAQGAFTPLRALYYSTVNAFTLGYGDLIPGSDLSRILIMLQLFTTLVFLIFVIPALMSVLSTEMTQSA